MRDKMLETFKEVFGDTDGVKVYFAPGRVNLIGEHTDYNGGHVFPCALTIGTYAAMRKRKDGELRFYSANFEEQGIIVSALDGLKYRQEDDWANYPKGVIWAMSEYSAGQTAQDKDINPCLMRVNPSAIQPIEYGMDIVFWGNIPNRSGLSSSASIEVLTAYILREEYHMDISLSDIALLCQYAENKFIGVNCGIMDQFAIAMGRKDQAVFLDTSDLSHEYAPIELGDAKLVIISSNKKRGLGDSKYNERRSECEQALALLKTVVDINSLGELTGESFDKYKHVIGDETLIRRAKHAVYENARTIHAVKALKEKDLFTFGKLMNESHRSLKQDYEVTGAELDTLVEAAWEQEGVIGARMTGAGFGGCTVNIVKEQSIESFVKNVGRIYEDTIGYAADFYIVEIGGGPQRL